MTRKKETQDTPESTAPKERYREKRKRVNDQLRTAIDEYATVDQWDELWDEDVFETFEPINRRYFKR